MVIQFLFLILGAGYAITEAESIRWKLLNTGIVVSSTVAGFALFVGYSLGNTEVTITDALTFGTIAGYIGCFGAIAGNKWRDGGIGKAENPMTKR